MTKKNIHKIFIPPKNVHFSENPKNIEIQNFEPQKMGRAYVCVKISEYPPPPLGVGETSPGQNALNWSIQRKKVCRGDLDYPGSSGGKSTWSEF